MDLKMVQSHPKSRFHLFSRLPYNKLLTALLDGKICMRARNGSMRPHCNPFVSSFFAFLFFSNTARLPFDSCKALVDSPASSAPFGSWSLVLQFHRWKHAGRTKISFENSAHLQVFPKFWCMDQCPKKPFEVGWFLVFFGTVYASHAASMQAAPVAHPTVLYLGTCKAAAASSFKTLQWEWLHSQSKMNKHIMYIYKSYNISAVLLYHENSSKLLTQDSTWYSSLEMCWHCFLQGTAWPFWWALFRYLNREVAPNDASQVAVWNHLDVILGCFFTQQKGWNMWNMWCYPKSHLICGWGSNITFIL